MDIGGLVTIGYLERYYYLYSMYVHQITSSTYTDNS